MKAIRTGLCGVFVVAITAGVSGCFPSTVGDLLGAGIKVLNGQISTLTAGEVKALNAVAIGVINESIGSNLEPITDAQAQAVADFFQANNLDTPEDFQQLADTAAQDPSSIEGLDDLATAFQGTETDINPDDLDPDELNDLLESIFTGNSSLYDSRGDDV
jgi:hypothetical protein